MLSFVVVTAFFLNAQAVKRYKQSTGLEVEPAVQAQAQVTAYIALLWVRKAAVQPAFWLFAAIELMICSYVEMLCMLMRVAAAVSQEQLDTGMAVFRRGQLTASLAYFEEASALMPLRSPVRSACCSLCDWRQCELHL